MKTIWELPPVVQDETRIMDPATWHAKKAIGNVYHQHHPYHSSPGFIRVGKFTWERLLCQRGQGPQLLPNLSGDKFGTFRIIHGRHERTLGLGWATDADLMPY